MLRRLRPSPPEAFAFTSADLARAQTEVTNPPASRQTSATVSLLVRVHEQNIWPALLDVPAKANAPA